MKIAILQFDPKLGKRDSNIARATAMLAQTDMTGVELLVLPEMSFTGYAFPSLEAINPMLEPTAAGPSTSWAIETARRFRCHVCVGYPERSTSEPGKNYNSLVTIDTQGEVLVNYRKSFLFEVDETWAEEGEGFLLMEMPSLMKSFSTTQINESEAQNDKVAMGICMDLSPYKFTAPFNKFEFGNHVVNGNARLVIVSMAWLTHDRPEKVLAEQYTPSVDNVSYWSLRLGPLVEQVEKEEVVVVFANRCGVEPGRVKTSESRPLSINDEGEQVVCYAGSSCVMGFKDGGVRIWDVLGRHEEAVLIVDTAMPNKYALRGR